MGAGTCPFIVVNHLVLQNGLDADVGWESPKGHVLWPERSFYIKELAGKLARN